MRIPTKTRTLDGQWPIGVAFIVAVVGSAGAWPAVAAADVEEQPTIVQSTRSDSPCAVGPTGTPAPARRELINEGDIYADAARYGDLVFTAGFLGLAPGDDFAADVEDSLDQLQEALEASGAGFDTLLKVNVYLTDWNNWETFDSTYHNRIAGYGLPPRTTVEVARLGLSAPIEMAAIAHVRSCTP